MATLNITVYDSAVNQNDEEVYPMYETSITKTGDIGANAGLTETDVKNAVKDKIGDYTLDKLSSSNLDKVKGLVYGQSADITVTATANVHGHGHTYVKFNETYYNKNDNGQWKSGTCYVCIHCGKALDEDELDKNMIDTDQNGDDYDTVFNTGSLSGKLVDHWSWSTDGVHASLYQIPEELDDCMMDCVWENKYVGSKRTTATVTIKSGNCTDGIVYSASANGKTATKTVKLDSHTYSYKWTWSDDDKATLTLTCDVCGNKVTPETRVTEQTTPATCETDGATVCIATASYGGQSYSSTSPNVTVIPATGHDFDENGVCKVCGQKQQESKITLSDKTVVYTGKVISCEASVTGSTGKVTYEYYVDKDMTQATTSENSGAAAEKGAPVKAGVYYVRAKVASDGNYLGATSNTAKLTITPEQVTGVKIANKETGIKITWSQTPGAKGYRVYRKVSGGSYEAIKTVSGASSVSYTDTGAKSGTVYYYVVKAYGKTTEAAWGTKSSSVKMKRLDQPTLKVANTSGGIKISWSKCTGADGYYVYRKGDGVTSWKRIATIKKNSTVSWSDTNVKAGTEYTYTVKAYSGNYTGSYNSGKTMKRLDQPTLKVANTSGGIKISWSKCTGADGYYVYRKGGGVTSWTKVAIIKKNSTVSWTDKDVKAGTKYTYTVKAYSGSYVGSYNSGKTIKRLSQPTPKVANASGGIKVSWNKCTGADGYYVYRKAGSATSWTKVATIKKNSTVSWTDTKVSNGTKYVYTVKAYSGSYVGSYNSGKTMYRVSRPSISSLKNSSSKKMTVAWSKNSKVTGYRIEYAANSSFDNSTTVTVKGANTVSKTISGLTKGKTYYVRVRGYKTVSGTNYWSSWSTVQKVKISK